MTYIKKNTPSGPKAFDGHYYIDKFKNIYGDRYSYNIDDFNKREIGIRNNELKISITCIHGVKEINVKRHLQGYECRYCKGTAKEKIAIKYEKIKKERKQPSIICNRNRGINAFIEKANLIHNNKYGYSEFKYINCKTKGIINCNIHGKFLQSPDNHINAKHGCPRCGSGGTYNEWYFNAYPEKKNKSAILYLADFSTDDENFIKIGITIKDLTKRLLAPSKNSGYMVSSILQYKTTLYSAWLTEQRIINDFKEFKYEAKRYFPRAYRVFFKIC